MKIAATTHQKAARLLRRHAPREVWRDGLLS
jgi:hypothetical protein